jgi:hypothetical protein
MHHERALRQVVLTGLRAASESKPGVGRWFAWAVSGQVDAESGSQMWPRVRNFGVGVLLSFALTALPGITQGADARWTGPAVVSGWKNGPVHIFSVDSYRDVATLDLPAGRWVAWAKLFISTDGWGGVLTVECKLDSAHGPSHRAIVEVTDGALDGTPRQSMALSTWASFRDGGKLVLSCRGAAAAHWIKIMAMRIGTLTTADLTTGTKKSVGSSQPTVVVGSKNAAITIVEGTAETVATMPLGAGNWAVRTSFTVFERSGFPETTCRLSVGGIVRDSARVLWNLGHTVVDLQTATPIGRGQSVKVTCELPNDPGETGVQKIDAGDVRITAVKLGTLVTFDGDGNAITHGSGLPKAYFKKAPKYVLSSAQPANVAWVDVEPGRWMAFSRAQLGSAVSNPWYFHGHLQCQLIAVPDYDQSHVERRETPGLPLAVVHRFSEGGRVKLRCGADDAEPINPTAITAIRVIAFKLGSLQNLAL